MAKNFLTLVGLGNPWTRVEYVLLKREVPGRPASPTFMPSDTMETAVNKILLAAGVVNIPDELTVKINKACAEYKKVYNGGLLTGDANAVDGDEKA